MAHHGRSLESFNHTVGEPFANLGRLTPTVTQCIRHSFLDVSDFNIETIHLLLEHSYALHSETMTLSLASDADRIHPHANCIRILASAVVLLFVSTPSLKCTVIFRMGRHMLRVLPFRLEFYWEEFRRAAVARDWPSGGVRKTTEAQKSQVLQSGIIENSCSIKDGRGHRTEIIWEGNDENHLL